VTHGRERATRPEDITGLLVERMNAGDGEGIAELYEPDAVMAFPPGQMTVGREAIREFYEEMISEDVKFKLEEPLPTLLLGDLALTATPASDEAGARAQVVRRQPDGTWLRILDRPDFRR
jgi:ketosteroid isomerase-like protein